jgi:hypothetical protein
MNFVTKTAPPTFFQAARAQFRFEWSRRWRLLALALFGLAVVPLARVALVPEDVLGAGFGVALAGGLCALFGYDAVVARQNDRSVAFDLLQPSSGAAVIFGRAVFGLVFGWLAFVVTMLPGAVVGGLSGRAPDPSLLLLGVVASPAGLLVGVALAGIFGTRDPWFVAHLLPAAAAALVLALVEERTAAFGVDVVFYRVVLWVLAATILGLLWGWWAQFEKGRVDPVRGHRALAGRLWLPIALVLLAAVAFTGWAIPPAVHELHGVAEFHQPVDGNPWVPVTLSNEWWAVETATLGYRQSLRAAYALRIRRPTEDAASYPPLGLPGDATRRGPFVPVPQSEKMMWSGEIGLRWLDLASGEAGNYPWPSAPAEQWTLAPDGARAIAVFLEQGPSEGLPHWSVRQLEIGVGLWSAPARLEGIAQRRYSPSFSWLSPEAVDRPLLRLTVALGGGLAWFDFPGATLPRSMAGVAARGSVGFDRLQELDSRLRNQISDNPVMPIHQHALSGDRVVLATRPGVVVVDGEGADLWQFQATRDWSAISSDATNGEGDSRITGEPFDVDDVVGATGAPIWMGSEAWRGDRLLVQSRRATGVVPEHDRVSPLLLEVVEGRVTRAIKNPSYLSIGPVLSDDLDRVALAWTEPSDHEAEAEPAPRRLLFGTLDLETFEVEVLSEGGGTNAWLVGRQGGWQWTRLGCEPEPARELLVTDLYSLYRVDLSRGEAERLLELPLPDS